MTAGHAAFAPVRAFGAGAPPAAEPSEWQQSLASPDMPLSDVLPRIRATGIAVIVDPEWRLLFSLTDADVRRALLAGAGLDDSVGTLMSQPSGPIAALHNAQAERVDPPGPVPLPIVDDCRRVVGIRRCAAPVLANRLVVVMAGGQGRRLRPLTDRCPKPLIPVDGRPLLELMLDALHAQGFRRFVFCVGYGADMIQRHFGDGRTFDVRIEYLRDRDRLGTAGPLTLLESPPDDALLVVNGDILTSTDFGRLMTYHDAEAADATLCICDVEMQVPYGVVSVAGGRVERIREKPVQPCRVNAGIYVLEPRVLDALPRDRSVNMPELFEALIRRGDRIAAFPIHEPWVDIGSPADLAQARESLARRPFVRAGTPPVPGGDRSRARRSLERRRRT